MTATAHLGRIGAIGLVLMLVMISKGAMWIVSRSFGPVASLAFVAAAVVETAVVVRWAAMERVAQIGLPLGVIACDVGGSILGGAEPLDEERVQSALLAAFALLLIATNVRPIPELWRR